MFLHADRRAARPQALPPGDGAGVDPSQRLPRLVGGRVETAVALACLSVVVVGCGSIGARVALGLARLGVRALLLVDFARHKPAGLVTHDITPDEVGRSKVACLGERARALLPTADVRVFEGPVGDLRDGDVDGADLVVLATDDLLAEVQAGAMAQRLGLRLVQAAVDGATLVAQVRTWPHAEGGADACLACGFGPAEWAALDAGTRYSCAGDDGAPALQQRLGLPTRSAGPLCSLAADMALLGVLRHVTGVGGVGAASLTEHAGLVDRTTVTPLRRNPRCRADHAVPQRAWLLRPLEEHSPLELLEAAGGEGTRQWSLTVDGYDLAVTPSCSCPDSGVVPRFLPTVGESPACPNCSAPLLAGPWARRREVPGELLAPVIHVPLRDLGAVDPVLVTVDAGSGRVLLGENS
jgi:molybdopterin/thiamine biosynthesis adenylyltransferase